jgi:cytochrome P450
MESPRSYVPDDLGKPELLGDPYPLYRAFRDGPPVYFKRIPAGAGPGIDKPIYAWGLLKHADIVAAVRAPEAFSSNTPSVLTMVPRFTVLHDDPPRHTSLRRLVQKAFSPRRVADLEPWMVRMTGELLDELGEGPTEILDGLARPLPMNVICAFLGIPAERSATFRHWSEATIGYAGIPADERRKRIGELHAFLGREVADRRTRHTDDLVTALVEAEIDGERLDDAEAVGFCMTLLVAGQETTTGLIGNCLDILAREPELWRRAREDRSLVDPILMETLRYASPSQRLSRVARKTVEIGGVTIREGDLVDVMYGAGNRDPAVFAEPDTFRVDRPAGAELLAFGSGIHYCLGAALAKTEARIALNAMLDRYARIEPGPEPGVRQRQAFATLNFVSLSLVLHER